MIIGKKILHYRVIDSTNTEARRLIKKGEGEGLVVVADEQTKGKGKPGYSWFSPRGNLYFSAVVKPYRNPKELSPITLLAALAAKSAITGLAGLPVVIKWPNDLLVNGKKIGGVLAERVPSGHIIMGIGINVNSPAKNFPQEIRGRSTTMRDAAGKRFALQKCSDRLMKELDREYLAYLSKV